MATTLYFPSSSIATPISPTADATWTLTAADFNRIKSPTGRTGTARTATGALATTVGSPSLFKQYISPQLNGAQSITGTFSAAVFGKDAASATSLKIIIKVFDSTGVTVRGTPFTDNFGTANTNWNAAGQTDFYNAAALTTVSALDGDYIVIEVGGYTPGAPTGSVSVTIGDDQATDYGYTALDTTTNKNDSIQFSGNIIFKGGVPNQLMLVGVGT